MKIQQALEHKLKTHFSPSVLQVINESPNHNTPEGSESHFRVLIVSYKFQNLSSVKRHQMVYGVIKQELERVHAFSQHTFTPEEWSEKEGKSSSSPPCMHKK